MSFPYRQFTTGVCSVKPYNRSLMEAMVCLLKVACLSPALNWAFAWSMTACSRLSASERRCANLAWSPEQEWRELRSSVVSSMNVFSI